MNELERARMMQIYRSEAQGLGGFQLGGYCKRKVETSKGKKKCISKTKTAKKAPKGFKAPTARLYIKQDGEFVTLASAQKKAAPKKKAPKKMKGGFALGGYDSGEYEGDDFLIDYLNELNGGAAKKNKRKPISKTSKQKWISPTGEPCTSIASKVAQGNPWVLFLKLNAIQNKDNYSDALKRAHNGGLAQEYAAFKKNRGVISKAKPKKNILEDIFPANSAAKSPVNIIAKPSSVYANNDAFIASLLPEEDDDILFADEDEYDEIMATQPITGQGRRRMRGGLRMR